MVGEIRDEDTASNVVQAAMTGHLCNFDHSHRRSSGCSITNARFVMLFAFRVVLGVVYQRLVRKVCPFCAVDDYLSEEGDHLSTNSQCPW